MPGGDATIIARVPKAVDEQLDKLVKETGRTKSELIREAVIALIGMHKNA